MLPSITKGRQLEGIYVQEFKAPAEPPGAAEAEPPGATVVYENGLRLKAFPTEFSKEQSAENAQQLIDQSGGKYSNITVHGLPGYGVGPNIVKVGDQEVQNPGTVSWWEDGVIYSVIGEGIELEELLEIAESVKQ